MTRRAVVSYEVDATPAEKTSALKEGLIEIVHELRDLDLKFEG